MTRDLILGTAGHIDHGKTALVHALTGVNTDRLPAEKQRGITIDIGFASLELGHFHIGIVDVPGHERFVKNMLAGATGIDLALLVVAADDSVMPQTREHLSILELLQLDTGIIAITKSDLVAEDWLDLVEEEIRELVKFSFLSDAPIIRTSATTGKGLDTLREVLEQTCHTQTRQPPSDLFRMSVDRSFAVEGHGTVVTGSIASGSVKLDDKIEVQPMGQICRVRSLHNHDQPANRISRGQRAAINLGGVHHREISRGQELAAVNYLRPSTLITTRLSILEESPWTLKHRSTVRLHIGTAEILSRTHLLSDDSLKPTDTGFAQFFLSKPISAIWNQPFVIRSESPVITIGGGQVIQPVTSRLRRQQPRVIKRLDQLISGTPFERISELIYFYDSTNWSNRDLCRDAGLSTQEADTLIPELIQSGIVIELPVSPQRTLRIHQHRLEEHCEKLKNNLTLLHEETPLQKKVLRHKLISRFGYLKDDPFVQTLIGFLITSKQISGNDHEIALKGHGPKLSNAEHKILQYILERFQQDSFQPPSVKEIQQKAESRASAVPELVKLCVGQGELVDIGQGVLLHTQWEKELRSRIEKELRDREKMSVAEIRDLLGTTRKFAIPICEYLDRIELTKRDGDFRILASSQ